MYSCYSQTHWDKLSLCFYQIICFIVHFRRPHWHNNDHCRNGLSNLSSILEQGCCLSLCANALESICSNLEQGCCLSLCANALEKGMNPSVLPAMGEIVGQTRFFSLGLVTSLGERKLEIQTRYTLLEKLTWYLILSVKKGLGKYILPCQFVVMSLQCHCL